MKLRVSFPVLAFAITLLFTPIRAYAQNPCNDEPYGPGCYWAFHVVPSADSLPLVAQSIAYFTLMNDGTNFESFTLTCSSSGGVSCAYDQGSTTLFGGTSTLVGVIFSASSPGALTLTATGFYSAWAEGGTTVVYDPYRIWLSATQHNGYNQSVALCTLSCFNGVMSYSTNAYFSLDVPRSVELSYTSRQVQARHAIVVNGGGYPGYVPEKLSLRLLRPNGTFQTFTNGSTEIYYQGAQTAQMGVQFDDSSLATGAYYYTIILRAYWGATVRELSVPVRLLVLNQRGSPYGAGWSIASLARVLLGQGDSLLTSDGEGSIQFWRRISCGANSCAYGAPAGEFDKLERLGPPTEPAGITYVRTQVDGTKLTFDWGGRLLYSDDVFNNRTRYVWRANDSERLDSIVDPVGKAIVFEYNVSNRLHTIRDLVGSRTLSPLAARVNVS